MLCSNRNNLYFFTHATFSKQRIAILNLSLFFKIFKSSVKKYVIIVAGGKGERMNAGLPKQFLPIGNKPILMHTLAAFYEYDPQVSIILVLPGSQFSFWKKLCEEHHFAIPHLLTEGGETRFHSVKNGLLLVTEDSLVAVHDGVRPFVSQATIFRCFEAAGLKGSAIPTTELIDSIRYIDEKGNKAVNRNNYRLIQTPQVFQSTLLKEAYQQKYTPDFTDDASVVEALGKKIQLVEGNKENIKITTPFDLEIAKILIEK
jgi:2-C-methyl-D-erythritol 4-phosphate cytidylyltransferase